MCVKLKSDSFICSHPRLCGVFSTRFPFENQQIAERKDGDGIEWNIKFKLTLDQNRIKQILILLRNRY